MAKLKTIYICEKCQATSPKWIGKCPECDAWNSLHEDVVETGAAKAKTRVHRSLAQKPVSIDEALSQRKTSEHGRIPTNIEELDRVLGGGIVEGGIVLLSGEPGIGKSTLTLDICAAMSKAGNNVLYVSGEESVEQIARRSKRLKIKEDNIQLVGENSLENVLETAKENKAQFIVVDSIQVISSHELPSVAGSPTQIRYCTESLMKFGKEHSVPVLIIGHVTKDGSLAGPKLLEHLVDAVLLIEGDRYQNLRIVRTLKNRYGTTNEIGLFEMVEEGLKPVPNAAELFLEGRKENIFGSAITTIVEGSRPLLLEVQALTTPTSFGYPRRTASGFDSNRLQLLLAVIQKHLHVDVSQHDVYINVIGGLKIKDPASDLAVIMAIISSIKQKPLPPHAIFLGEVGLSGEIRGVSQLAKRVREAQKIGFTQAFIPKTKEKIFATSNANKITHQLSDLGDAKQILSKTTSSPRKATAK